MVPTVSDSSTPHRLTDLPTWQLSRVAARSHQVLHERLRIAGVTGYEFRVLAVVADLGPVSQTELGRAAELDRRDVAVTVRDLESRGMVERAPDPAHRQRKLVSLTALGERTLADLERVIAAVQREVFGALDDAEMLTLLGYLSRLGG